MGIRISSSNIVQSDSQNVKEEFRKPSERKLSHSFQKRARWIFPYDVRGGWMAENVDLRTCKVHRILRTV